MKAISILQPWASALLGPKDIENRSWYLPLQYLGVPLALHASKRQDIGEMLAFARVMVRAIPESVSEYTQMDYPYGAIIGVIAFSHCVEASDSPWFFGPVGWVKASVTPIDPIPCRGALGLWAVPEDIAEEIRRRVGAPCP